MRLVFFNAILTYSWGFGMILLYMIMLRNARKNKKEKSTQALRGKGGFAVYF